MLGSSSGAFVTAIAACGVAPRHAAEEMLQLLVRDGLTKRRTGLLGVMGKAGVPGGAMHTGDAG